MLVTYPLYRGFPFHCVSALLRFNCIWILDAFAKVSLRSWLAFKLWLRSFRQGLLEVSINTNSGVERKSKDFKHEFLKPYKDNSLTGMVTVLIDQFHPAKEMRYIKTTELSASGKVRHFANISQHLLDKIKVVYLKTKKGRTVQSSLDNLKVIFHWSNSPY